MALLHVHSKEGQRRAIWELGQAEEEHIGLLTKGANIRAFMKNIFKYGGDSFMIFVCK